MEPAPNPAAMREPRLIEGVVSNLSLFAGTSPGQIAAVVRHCWAVPARRGDVLARQGERLSGMFAVAYGQVKLTLRRPGSEERVLRLASAGEVFGEAEALLGRECSYEALALVESKLVVIPPMAIFGLIDRDSRFARNMVKVLAERSFELLGEIESLTMRDGAQRLASYLVSLARPVNGSDTCTVRLPVSKTLVAARLGVKKETLSRLLRALTDQGLIEVTRREITLLDRTRLAEASR